MTKSLFLLYFQELMPALAKVSPLCADNDEINRI